MARGPFRDSRSEAEKAFKQATTKPADLPPAAPAVPGAREQVSLRIDRDVLDYLPGRRAGLAGADQCGAAQGGGEVASAYSPLGAKRNAKVACGEGGRGWRSVHPRAQRTCGAGAAGVLAATGSNRLPEGT